MSNPSYPLRINIGSLIHQPNGTYNDFHFELPGLFLSSDLDVSSFKGITRVSRTTQGLLVQCNFHGQIKVECVRCLLEYDQFLQSELTELFVFPRNLRYDYEEQSEEPPELVLPDDGYINLAPLVWEYLLLEIPIQSLCRPDCKGLCSVCGANLNETECAHQPEAKKRTAIPRS